MICPCGTLFHKKGIKKDLYSKDYAVKYLQGKKIEERFDYFVHCYAPVIEEMTMGRKFLDVGFTLDRNIEEMKRRGWVSTGIELFENPYIQGDFEKHDFKKERYDFIKMGHVLECLDDPIRALAKAVFLLEPRGVMFVSCVDAEALWHVGMQNFGHWGSQERWWYPSERQFVKIAESLQLKVVMRRKNFGRRFSEWNDFHLILQKDHV